MASYRRRGRRSIGTCRLCLGKRSKNRLDCQVGCPRSLVRWLSSTHRPLAHLLLSVIFVPLCFLLPERILKHRDTEDTEKRREDSRHWHPCAASRIYRPRGGTDAARLALALPKRRGWGDRCPRSVTDAGGSRRSPPPSRTQGMPYRCCGSTGRLAQRRRAKLLRVPKTSPAEQRDRSMIDVFALCSSDTFLAGGQTPREKSSTFPGKSPWLRRIVAASEYVRAVTPARDARTSRPPGTFSRKGTSGTSGG